MKGKSEFTSKGLLSTFDGHKRRIGTATGTFDGRQRVIGGGLLNQLERHHVEDPTINRPAVLDPDLLQLL
jgi:hypothetical protein